MASPRNTVMRAYPRLWGEDDPPEQSLYGFYDINELGGWRGNTLIKQFAEYRVPFPDGPDVNGYPTWTRITALGWLYLLNRVPAHLIGDAQTLLGGPDGKVVLERLKAQLFPDE